MAFPLKFWWQPQQYKENTMDERIIAIYCLADDLLIAHNHQQHPQARMTDAEVITTAIVAAIDFRGNFEKARPFLKMYNYIPNMLSKSRFNRRLHRVKPMLLILFAIIGERFKDLNAQSIYVIDTLPIAVCDNIRISRSKLYNEEAYRGYQSSKKRYFYGLKIHLLVTADGMPVEFFLTPGGVGDVSGLELFDFDLPPDSCIYGDKAYNFYEIEDVLQAANLHLVPIRKANSLRPHPPWRTYLAEYYRKRVETAGSQIERLLPKSIHATTQEGFELKVVLFCLATSINGLF